MKLVAMRLETCHANSDGVAWYAYFEGVCDLRLCKAAYADKSDPRVERGPLGVLEWAAQVEEVPDALSRHTGLRRWYVADAG